MLAIDAGGLHSLLVASAEPWIFSVYFAGALVVFWPLVFASAVGLLSISDPGDPPEG